MPLLDLTNPEVVNYLAENYEKATRLWLKWNTLNADKLKAATTLHRKETSYTTEDVTKSIMVAGMAIVQRDHIAAANNRRLTPVRDGIFIPGVANPKKRHSIVEVGLGDPKEDPRLDRLDSDTTWDPVMRVVQTEQKNIIYEDIPDFGNAYLKNRCRKPSEDRYYFPECTSWDYGWRLKDSKLASNRPSYGRVSFTHCLKNRTGSYPDPAYYNNCDILVARKCRK